MRFILSNSRIQANMELNKQKLEQETRERINKLQKDNTMEREKILSEHRQKMTRMTSQVNRMEEKIKRDAEEHKKLRDIIEKRNYEAQYPIPLKLKRKKSENPGSFFIQVLGSRGCGKSTFLNNLLKRAKIPGSAKTGVNETTITTEFFDVTAAIARKPTCYTKVFLCDQPGIGGLEINELEYLEKFGPGKLKSLRQQTRN